MSSKRQPTLARGAVIQRDLVVRRIRRMLASDRYPATAEVALLELLEWLQTQRQRTARPGGIGRR